MEDKQQPLFKCESHDCNSEAVFRVHWPGQDKRFCLLCAVRAERVAFLMGFKLSMTPLYALLLALLALLGCSSSRETQHQMHDASTPARLATHTHDVHQLAPRDGSVDAHLVELDAGSDAGRARRPPGRAPDAGSDAAELDADDGSVDADDAGKPKPPPPECMPAFFCQ